MGSRRSSTALTALVLWAAAQAPLGAHDGPTIEDARRAVEARLFDPYTAQIEILRVVDEAYDRFVCGTVNAKNRFGAFVGHTPFVYRTGIKELYILSDKAAIAAAGYENISPCFP